MLQTWPLHRQMYAIVATWFLGGMIILLVSIIVFANIHLHHEREPIEQVGHQVVSAIQNTVRQNPASLHSLKLMAAELKHPGVLSFRPDREQQQANYNLDSVPYVPDWFTRMVEPQRHEPVILLVPELDGQLLLRPDMAADILEKWVAFVAALIVPLVISLATILTSRRIINDFVRPLVVIKDGISALRSGSYGRHLSIHGPREVVHTGDELNSLSSTLEDLRSTNIALHRKLLSVQEEERAEIAQDLHDELGPLIFALRANITALDGQGTTLNRMLIKNHLTEIAEAIQRTNRRILDRLRVTNIAELGLMRSIQALLEGPAARVGNLQTTVQLDAQLDLLDELTATTVYRVIQESLTNALRHSSASGLLVQGLIARSAIGSFVELAISDNGIGYPASAPRGHGLSGMEERLTALGGTFHIEGSTSGTTIRCTIPLELHST
jgi:two-component system sensor histidine kinase UhpB